ncbi:head decoration protein [Klebsiella pneumoniae]|uniref:head decoration protein n=1 Tax=Klebsiella pneumoniae TaxID=573 RepID=UPI0021C7C7A3|nr:head decoration protein [Klebsiella pneumoniae]MCU0144860.1 head decoration protein [Klebsiella pneumoniae]
METPYLQLLSGTQQVATTMVAIAGGQGEIPAYTPLMVDAAQGLFKVWDGAASGDAVYLTASGDAVYLTASVIDATDEVNAQVYKCGTFNIDVINWPTVTTEDATTELTQAQKLAAFAGSAVSAQPLI